jgi:hypothetical protein
MAPAGAVGLAGVVGEAGPGLVLVVDGGGGIVLLGCGVGNVVSVGPVPGVATGLPSMMELQPETNMGPASTAESSSEPPAKPHRAFCDNRTRYSPKCEICSSQTTQEWPQVAALTRFWNVADGKVLPLRGRLGRAQPLGRSAQLRARA